MNHLLRIAYSLLATRCSLEEWASGSVIKGSALRSKGRRFDSRVHRLSD